MENQLCLHKLKVTLESWWREFKSTIAQDLSILLILRPKHVTITWVNQRDLTRSLTAQLTTMDQLRLTWNKLTWEIMHTSLNSMLVTHLKSSEVFLILVPQTLGSSTRLLILDKVLTSNSLMMMEHPLLLTNSPKRQLFSLDLELSLDILWLMILD